MTCPIVAVLGASGIGFVLSGLTAALAASVVIVVRQTDTNHLASTTRNLLLLIFLPVILIITQLLPVPLSWAHPIWTTFTEATGGAPFGSITVDIGRTVAVLTSAVSLIAAAASCLIVARDRRLAEWVFISAGAVSAALSLLVILQNALPGHYRTIPSATAIQFASLGVLINSGVALLAWERRETRKREAAQYLPIELGSILAVLISAICLMKTATTAQAIPVGLGVIVLGLIMTIRRLNLSLGAVVTLCAATLIGMGILATWLFGTNAAASGLLRFIPTADAEAAAVLERILADGRWLGSGAGTMDVLTRIYQTSDAAGGVASPTAMIQLSIEAGWVGLCVWGLVSLGFSIKLTRGALERGRDWFFPAVAAACLVCDLFASFVSPGLLETPVLLMTTIIVAAGLSQAASQSGRH